MRVPPQPRRSRYRYVLQALRVMQDTVTFLKVRERWHLHKVHKTSRANCCKGVNGRKYGANLEHSETPIRLEDIANQPSGTVTAKKRRMPLLIASFPKGGSRSPRFNVLEKNRKFKAIVSRRKYKLKSFNGGTDRLRSPKGKKNGVKEYLVKKELLKHAHLKVNYHRKGVMNSTCVLVDSEVNAQPEFLTFDRGYSIRLSDFPSLSIRQAIQA